MFNFGMGCRSKVTLIFFEFSSAAITETFIYFVLRKSRPNPRIFLLFRIIYLRYCVSGLIVRYSFNSVKSIQKRRKSLEFYSTSDYYEYLLGIYFFYIFRHRTSCIQSVFRHAELIIKILNPLELTQTSKKVSIMHFIIFYNF